MSKALRAAWDEWEVSRPTAERALSRAAFRALVNGWAPTVAELAPMAGLSPDLLTSTLETMVAQGLATVDETRITGIGGLSLVPAPHALEWQGRTYWTWCALDAIGIPMALGGHARVTSRIALDGTPIVLRFDAGVWNDPDPTLGIQLAEPSLARPLCGGT